MNDYKVVFYIQRNKYYRTIVRRWNCQRKKNFLKDQETLLYKYSERGV